LRFKYRSPRLAVLFGTAVVLALLAFLQYRWILQASEAEEKRLQEDLNIAMSRFAEDFGAEMRLLAPPGRPEPPPFGETREDLLERAAARYERWMAAPRHPELLQYFEETFLPSLVQQHFPKKDNFDYEILIPDVRTGKVVYRSSPELVPADFRLDVDDSIRLPFPGAPRPPPPPNGPPMRPRREGPEGGIGWQLYARHRAGSLQSFTDDFRRRNLAISMGVFAILAVGIGFTFWSSERVRAMGRLQLEFAAGLSHELRTPLAAIRSAGYNLAAGNVAGEEEVVKYGNLLQEQGVRLSNMVEQALLFGQTQSRRNTYERTPVDVEDVIRKAIESCRATFPHYSGEVAADVSPDSPLAMTNANAMGHCLHNLVMNAMKYGESPGSITVIVRPDLTRKNPELAITVENRGAGINRADLPRLFEPFYRGANAGGASGSGLGLYIVKSIIESLDGRVTVSSSATGTRFTLHVPALIPSVEV
jgi:signal transduction histidine kinase